MKKKNEICWECQKEIKPGDATLHLGHFHFDCYKQYLIIKKDLEKKKKDYFNGEIK